MAIGLGELVGRGSRSSVYAWGRGAVAKFPDPATPDSWIHAEAAYTAAVREAGAPAPQVLGIEQVEGRPVVIYERIHGPSMWQYVVDHPDRAPRYGRTLGELHADLFDLVPPMGLPDQLDRLRSKIRWAADHIDPALSGALALLPVGDRAFLCHGDLHPGNVILSPEGPIIVDWFDASRGSSAADVARTSLLLSADGLQAPQHLPGADSDTLGLLADAYVAFMQKRLGITVEALGQWQAVEAVARLAEGVDPPQLLNVWYRHDRRPHVAAVPSPADAAQTCDWKGQPTGG